MSEELNGKVFKTDKEQEKFVRNEIDCCPVCKSVFIETVETNDDGVYLTTSHSCEKCGSEWDVTWVADEIDITTIGHDHE